MASSLPRPKSPPELYAKRRELAKVVMLEREIGFLKEELKSIEKLEPASFYIKEVADYVLTTPEPLVTVKAGKSCGFWKWLLCGDLCFNMSYLCRLSNGCSLEMPHCCSLPCCCDCCSWSIPKCTCAFKPPTSSCKACLKPFSCCPNCNSGCCTTCDGCTCCWPTTKCRSCSCWPTKCSCPNLPKCSTCSLKNNCCYSSSSSQCCCYC